MRTIEEGLMDVTKIKIYGDNGDGVWTIFVRKRDTCVIVIALCEGY